LLLGMERMFRDDFADGSLEYMLFLRLYIWLLQCSPTGYGCILSRYFDSHRCFALFLNLTFDMYVALMLTLLLGTPLACRCYWKSSVGLHRGGVLFSIAINSGYLFRY
jgi:heme exporter protein B